jgi:hypothetical protein
VIGKQLGSQYPGHSVIITRREPRIRFQDKIIEPKMEGAIPPKKIERVQMSEPTSVILVKFLVVSPELGKLPKFLEVFFLYS